MKIGSESSCLKALFLQTAVIAIGGRGFGGYVQDGDQSKGKRL